MNIPKLRKEKTVKKYHGYELTDHYAYVDQPHNIIEVLQNPEKLLPEVRKYLEENNKLTEEYFSDTRNLQKKLFTEIKSKIKLTDESLKFKDDRYFYWTKTIEKGNYTKYLRQKIGSEDVEIIQLNNVINELKQKLEKKDDQIKELNLELVK